jgi:hypothetical protein
VKKRTRTYELYGTKREKEGQTIKALEKEFERLGELGGEIFIAL